MVPFCGATRIRTGDTRIFSPLLYQLSYSTLITEAANINTSILSIKEKGIIIYNIHTFGKDRRFMGLMIDIGNTRTKYAYFSEGRIREKGSCSLEDTPRVVSNYSKKASPTMFSSVKPIPKSILLESAKHSPNLIVLSSEIEMPFTTNYKTLQTLGTDRLALVAGAVFTFPTKPVLVIDAGTCITFDFVDSKKRHLGGSISPGLQMRLKALSNQTGALPAVELSEPEDLIGTSTKESILSGVVNGAIKELDGTIDVYQKRYPDIIVLLTGGDARFFDKKLKNSIFADEDVLLKGMYFILKQHANK